MVDSSLSSINCKDESKLGSYRCKYESIINTMNNFRKLKIWDRSVELATVIYDITKNYPKNEMYGIVSQMRRSVVSISSNIAEGAGRQSKKEFKRFLNIAKGSSYELETQLTISKNLGFITHNQFDEITRSLIELHKMIHSLIKTLNKK